MQTAPLVHFPDSPRFQATRPSKYGPLGSLAPEAFRDKSVPRLNYGRAGSDMPKIRDRRARGTVLSMEIEALPDTGTDRSFISTDLLDNLRGWQAQRTLAAGDIEIEVMKLSNPTAVK